MRELTYVEAAREGLAEEMERDPSVFVMGEGIGARGGNFNTTAGLYERFGAKRLRDAPICERGFTTLCTGAAMAGARPVVDFMFTDFLLDALGDLINQTGKIQWLSDGRVRMPIVLRGCMGVVGSVGAHHSGSYYPFFVHCPGFVVALPASPRDAKGLIKTAIRANDPVLFLEHRALLTQKEEVPEEEYLIPFGRARIVREGTDATVVALSHMVVQAMAAAEELTHEGVSVEIIDPRTVAPLDIDSVLESVRKTGRLLVVDEDFAPCGIGAEIAAQVVAGGFDNLDAPIHRLNGAFVPAPSSPALEGAVVPSVQSIAEAVRRLLEE